MQQHQLGTLWPVSRLTLGGGGLGQVWGKTTRTEAIATVRAAVDAGINLFDVAPGYGRGEAENVIGEAFNGKPGKTIRLTSKCQLGSPTRGEIESQVRRRIERSLTAMKLEQIDIYFLHSNIIPDDYRFPDPELTPEVQARFATTWTRYIEEVIPTFEALLSEGKIAGWGITGVGLPSTILAALTYQKKPDVVQVITNCLDSPGAIQRFEEDPQPRNIIAVAQRENVGVLGIRAVQAGALTDRIDRELPMDHPESRDFERAAPLRALAAELGVSTAYLAHAYALSMPGVDSVVLGVKNRSELEECVAAEVTAPLDQTLMDRIDALFGRSRKTGIA